MNEDPNHLNPQNFSPQPSAPGSSPNFSPQPSDFSLSDFLARHVRPYDPATDDYDRPPFAADIKEGKNDPIYNAHSYHTKVPPRSISPYILHYTQPGDVVLDPFCGSGMTGVAAQMCANPPADILEQFPELKDRVGPRVCILNDLSPAACHIAYNYNMPVGVQALKDEFERIKAAVKQEFDWLYGTEHYEPAVGLYDPANYEVASRLKTCGTGVPPVDHGPDREKHGRDAHATCLGRPAQEFATYNPHVPVERRQGAYLPHWTQEGATYAVSFRLGDSLPQQVWESFLKERNDIIKRTRQQDRKLTDAERERLDELYSDRVEAYLDAGHGACWLRQEPVAQLVQNALRYFDGQRYRLAAWCVMPNHVHVVVQPLAGHTLPDILHSWKSFTSKEALKILGRDAQATARGPGVPPVASLNKFWQAEYYDHLIRDQSDLERQVRYTLDNPAQAGLKDWKWLGRAPGLREHLYAPGAAPDKILGQDGQATCGTGVSPVTQAQDAPDTTPGFLFEELGRDAQATRTWELLTKAQVEERLGYPVTELPYDEDWGKLNVATAKQWICIPATMEFTVWSDTNRCEGLVTLEESSVSAKGKTVTRKKRVPRGCGKEIVLWEAAVDKQTREVLSIFACPHCQQKWKKGDVPRLRSVPVLTRYEAEDIRRSVSARERPITRRETELIQEIDARTIEHWHPQEPWDDRREMWRGGHRDAGITTTADFYTRRSLRALSLFWHLVSQVHDLRIRKALQFLLTSISGRYAKTTRYLFGKAGNSGITGTLYVASFTVENALSRIVGNKWPDVLVALEAATKRSAACFVKRGSAGALSGIADSSVDYIFTDPPFGSNLFYGDCSFLWESWLCDMTDLKKEAVWNKSVKAEEGGKSLDDYRNLMAAAFGEMFRVLKPGRWATVEFNNSDGKVFAAIKQVVTDAGFHIANMLLLDKAQKSFKQTKGATGEEDVVDKDVLFNLHKPAVARAEASTADHDLEHQVADAVRQHLQTLPERIKAEPGKYNDEHRTTATINSMLMNVLIPKGVSVERLNLPFIERVCARYFRKVGNRWYLRGQAVGSNGGDALVEEEVVIKDEVTAIDWLRQKLRGTGVPPVAQGQDAEHLGQDAQATWHGRPAHEGMLIGELKPLWMRATGLLPAALSQSLILDFLLTENFWRDPDTNRWREPTAEERERMNDDRSLRVLHDAERYLGGSLTRQTTDEERCRWIEVLFKACRDIEEKQAEALPALRGFDTDEAYRVITRLFQSVLKDHVLKEAYTRAEKQARAASQHIRKQAEPAPAAKLKQDAGDGQSELNLG